MVLLSLWNGKDAKVLEPLMEGILRYERKYKYSLKILPSLPSLLVGFPPDATTEIDNYFNAEYMDKCESNEQLVKDFAQYVWHKIPLPVRTRQCGVSTEELERIYQETLKELHLNESSFWPLRRPRDVVGGIYATTHNDNHETNKSTNKNGATKNAPIIKVNKYPVSSEQVIKKVMEILRKYPDLCINCFHKHDWKECPDLSAQPSMNLAAWIATDYEEVMKNKRPAYMQRNAQAIARWIPK